MIAHIGNGMRSEVDHALDIILTLLEHNFKSMKRFGIFIKVATKSHDCHMTLKLLPHYIVCAGFC